MLNRPIRAATQHKHLVGHEGWRAYLKRPVKVFPAVAGRDADARSGRQERSGRKANYHHGDATLKEQPRSRGDLTRIEQHDRLHEHRAAVTHIVLSSTERRQTQVKLRNLTKELPGVYRYLSQYTGGQRAAAPSNAGIQESCEVVTYIE